MNVVGAVTAAPTPTDDDDKDNPEPIVSMAVELKSMLTLAFMEGEAKVAINITRKNRAIR